MLKKEGKKFLNQQLQSVGQGGGQQPMPQYQPMPQMMPQAMPQAMPADDRSLQTVDMYGEDGMKVMKYRGGGLVGGQHKLDKNKDGKISGADFKMMPGGGMIDEDMMMGKGGVMKYRGGGMIYADGSDKIPTYLSLDPKAKEIAFLDPQSESDLTVSRTSPQAGHSRDRVFNPQSESGIQRMVDLGLASKAFVDDKDYTRDSTLDEGTLEDQRKEYLSAQHAIMRTPQWLRL